MDCFKDVWDFPDYQQYSILAVDLPGFGGSDRPLNFSYHMEEQATIIKLLIQHLNLDRIHVVGHSMGGAIGILLAREIKPIVKSFICLEGNLVSEDCTVSREAVRYSLPDFLSTGFQLMQCLSKNDAYPFYRSAESLVNWSDSGKLLEFFLGLDISKYYIFGAQNAGAPVMSKLTSVSKLAIPNAGHSMMTDNPSRFYSELLHCIQQT
jgi:pimeloyl-ACP methyl ester carboxylesterase